MTKSAQDWLKQRGFSPQPDGSFSKEDSAKPATTQSTPAKSPPPEKRKAGPSPLATKFEALWADQNGPILAPEFEFHKKRKWRFDYCCQRALIAIELDGGIHGVGSPCPRCKRRQAAGHSTASGFTKDCEKLNAAAEYGYRVFRLATGMVKPDAVAQIIAAIHKIINSEP